MTVFLSIYKAGCQNSPENILTVWKLVLANYAIMVPFTALMVLFVCLRRHLNVRQFLRNISAPAILAFTTCSGTLAMTKQFETAKNNMKKNPKLVEFWVPLSQAMFAPAVIPALVAGAFFAGSFNGTPLSLSDSDSVHSRDAAQFRLSQCARRHHGDFLDPSYPAGTA